MHIHSRWRPLEPGQDGGIADEDRIDMTLHASGYPESEHTEIGERVKQETLFIPETRRAQVEALTSAVELEGTIDRQRIVAILAGLGSGR